MNSHLSPKKIAPSPLKAKTDLGWTSHLKGQLQKAAMPRKKASTPRVVSPRGRRPSLPPGRTPNAAIFSDEDDSMFSLDNDSGSHLDFDSSSRDYITATHVHSEEISNYVPEDFGGPNKILGFDNF